MSSTQNVTIFGVGNIGAALSHALMKAGTRLTVWNRTATKPLVKSVVEAGAILETNVRTAIAGSDLLIFSVLDYNAIYTLLEPIHAVSNCLAGKIIVNVTNGTPAEAVGMDEWTKAQGAAHYFDGAVLVTPQMVGTPHSLLIYSGETQDIFDGIKATLASLGLPLYYGPKVGSAATHDTAMLATMCGMFYGALVGMGILRRAGNEVSPGTRQVTTAIIGALVPHLDKLAAAVDSGDAGVEGSSLFMMLPGLKNILQTAEDLDVDASGLKAMGDAIAKAINDGRGDEGLAATLDYMLK